MKLLLQFPEGLKKEALSYARKYERKGHEVFLSASPCYGGCDVAVDEAKAIGAKKIIHFGHSKFIRAKLPIPVEYIEYKLDVDIEILKNSLAELKNYNKIALGTTVQYVHKIPAIKKFFESHGKTVFVGKGSLAVHDGQILGCDALAVTRFEKKADAIIFIGEGDFHYLAVDSQKSVFALHPKTGQIKKINDEIERLRKRRKGSVLKAVDAKTFGVVISTKSGQFNPAMAKWAKKELEKRGKTVAILVSNEIEPLALNNFLVFDCYITTACPKLAGDFEEFGKPVLNIGMLREALQIIDALKKK